MYGLIEWSLAALRTNGIDPRKTKIFHKFLSAFTIICNATVLVITGLELLLNWNGVKTVAKVEALPNTMLCFVKLLCLMYHKDRIFGIIQLQTSRFWSSNKFGEKFRRVVDRPMIRVFRLYKFYLCICMTTTLILSFKPLIMKQHILPFPGYDVCDFNQNRCFVVQATFQAFHIIFQLYPVIMGFDGLYIGLITTIYAQLELTKRAFLEITYKKKGPEKHRALREVITHHNFILNYINMLNNIYTRMLFIKYWTMLVAVTFSLYMITRNGFPPDRYLLLKYGPYCANLLIQFGLYCTSGAILNDQVASVSNAVYEINWWMKGETKTRKSLAFIIQRAQRIDRLTIGKMYDLNLVSYMNLLKNVMSIYTLLDKLSTTK